MGNCGAEIALETSHTHETWLAGKPSAEMPFRHGRTAARFVLPVVRFAGMHVLNTNTPVGRRVLPKLAAKASPLIIPALLPGVCRDAKYLAKQLAATRAPEKAATVGAGLAA